MNLPHKYSPKVRISQHLEQIKSVEQPFGFGVVDRMASLIWVHSSN